MRRLRDIFYVSANFEEQYFRYYGMEFNEFIRYNPVPLENILITDGVNLTNHYNRNWCLETAKGSDDILELSEENIYNIGNFHWIDYKNEEDINKCTPVEMSEVLYLSHFCKPLGTPFFSRINNDFVYLSHDDGWCCKLYCKDMSIFKDIIANKIIESFSTNKKRKIYPMDEEIKTELLKLTQKGMLIDFSNIIRDSKLICINFYAIGHFSDMDEMYNNREHSKNKADRKGTITHTNKGWKITIWD